jgi:hypothetical protein
MRAGRAHQQKIRVPVIGFCLTLPFSMPTMKVMGFIFDFTEKTWFLQPSGWHETRRETGFFGGLLRLPDGNWHE